MTIATSTNITISMYQATVPLLVRALDNVRHELTLAQAYAKAKDIHESTMLQSRLIADMLPLVKQVQIATDMAKNCMARLANVEPLKFEDNETSFDELHARLQRASDYIKSFKPEQINGTETRPINLKTRFGELDFEGLDYVLHFVIPNVFFHCTTVHNILRANGVNIGKTDFLGKK